MFENDKCHYQQEYKLHSLYTENIMVNTTWEMPLKPKWTILFVKIILTKMKYTIPKEVYTDLQEVNKDTSFCLGNLSLVRKCYLWHENQGVLWSCSSIFLPFQNLSPSKRNSISVFCLRPLAGVHPLTNNNLINVTLTY